MKTINAIIASLIIMMISFSFGYAKNDNIKNPKAIAKQEAKIEKKKAKKFDFETMKKNKDLNKQEKKRIIEYKKAEQKRLKDMKKESNNIVKDMRVNKRNWRNLHTGEDNVSTIPIPDKPKHHNSQIDAKEVKVLK